MTNRETLDATLPIEGRWPATRQNPLWAHRGDWWINEPLVQRCFGGTIDDLDTLRRCSQLLQAQGLAYAVESNRRRQWRNSGSIPWQFNEPFPNGWCTSAVDYFGRPKPAYHAVARAYAPLALSAAFRTFAWGGRDRFNASVWVANATTTGYANARLEWRLVGASGAKHARGATHVDVRRLAATKIVEIEPPLAVEEVFFLDLRLAELAAARYVFSATADLAPLLALGPTRLEHDLRVVGETAAELVLHNAGARAAIGVIVHDPRPAAEPGYLYVEPNAFDLLPGEDILVNLRWDGTGPLHPLAVETWNAPLVELVASRDPALIT
jgi:beta-mannosidase